MDKMTVLIENQLGKDMRSLIDRTDIAGANLTRETFRFMKIASDQATPGSEIGVRDKDGKFVPLDLGSLPAPVRNILTPVR